MKKSKKEKKNSKINEWWQTFKLLWADTRYRAMIKMGMYVVFVGGVLLFIQIVSIMNRNTKEVVYKTPLELFSEKISYQYQIKLEEQNTAMITQEVNGTKDDITNKFTVLGNPTSYVIQNGLYYTANETGAVLVDNPLLFDINRLTPLLLKELIEAGEEVANTTYKNGTRETTYEIPLHSFVKIYTGTVSELTGTISCKVQLEGDIITKISIDWTNYRKLQLPTVVNSNLSIIFH